MLRLGLGLGLGFRVRVRVRSTLPMVSSTSETKGMATAVRSMQSREKTKAMISCRMVPGTTSTQKPTRKSLWCAGAIVEREMV